MVRVLINTGEDGLLCLTEEHEDAGAAGGHQLVLFFLEVLGDGEAVGVFIEDGLAVREDHVAVGVVPRDVFEHQLPDTGDFVVAERQAFPTAEGTGEFDGGGEGFAGLSGFRTPTKDFAEGGWAEARPGGGTRVTILQHGLKMVVRPDRDR